MITLQFRIKKYLPLLFTIFISTIFLSNCARLPKPSIKNKTILVVKDEFVNTSKLPPQMRMKFNPLQKDEGNEEKTNNPTLLIPRV